MWSPAQAGRVPSRRALLRSVGAALSVTGSAGPWNRSAPPTRSATDDRPPLALDVRVHTVPTLADATVRLVVRAVTVGVEQVARTADRRLDRGISDTVSRGATAPADRIVTATRESVPRSATNWLQSTDRLASDAVHLVLVDEPLGQSIGYGSNRTHLGDPPVVGYANVGATELWEAPAVTGNIAIHEVLHGLVTPREVRAVLGRGCEHDLGAIHPVGGEGAIVTPLATAYASTAVGEETQWPGSGCTTGFSQGVAFEPAWWGHTYACSRATLDATTRFLRRLE
jgi:hypothetical protein